MQVWELDSKLLEQAVGKVDFTRKAQIKKVIIELEN